MKWRFPGVQIVFFSKKSFWNRGLIERAQNMKEIEQWPYRAVAVALEVIPRTLAQNCGANVIRTLTKLRAKHAEDPQCMFGIDGISGEIVDMKSAGIWEPFEVKVRLKIILQSIGLSWNMLFRPRH